MSRIVFLTVFALLIFSPSNAAAREDPRQNVWSPELNRQGYDRRGDRHRGRGRFELEFGEPREILRTEGGAVRVWSEDIEALRNTHVGIAEVELEENGLLVPQYTDAEKIAVVKEGCGWMGAVIPAQGEFRRKFVRRVRPGDVIAIPKGVVYWWYNDGNQRHRVLCASDTSRGTNPGTYQQFGLAGGQQREFGSVLHGFSTETLASAWGVDERMVEELLQSQKDASIVRTERKIRFPEPEREGESYDYYRRHHRQYDDEDRDHENENENDLQGQHERYRDHSSVYFEELKYSMADQHPDLYVRDGGWLKLVNRHKLPVLQNVGFSAMKVRLENNAVCAPSFVRNAHQILFITRGDGRIQIASNDGETVYDNNVREGSVIVIPQFFPSIKIAGQNGMEWINILTSARPSPSFLAGRNSMYRGIPRQVVAAAFNVEEEMVRELGQRREEQEVIFPGARKLELAREQQEEEKEDMQSNSWLMEKWVVLEDVAQHLLQA